MDFNQKRCSAGVIIQLPSRLVFDLFGGLTCIFLIRFMYSDGFCPYAFLNATVKVFLLLKPDSSAIAFSFFIFHSSLIIFSLTCRNQHLLINSLKFIP